jgi:tRNA1Val (adenine37-N6)-methyltransferase
VPNDYFQFQQFRVDQSHCAMKVSTDACLLGAVVDLTGATRLLDVGTGTGLLALMAAQRHPTVSIEAVEIDQAAAAQAAANAASSTWGARMQVWALSLAQYAATRPAPFSHIVCNPPFFQQSWPSADAARNTARHVSAASLSFAELAAFAAEFLLPSGTLTLLLPPPEMARFTEEARNHGLHLGAHLAVRHRVGGRVTRHISCFRLHQGAVTETELVINDSGGAEYSEAFRQLLTGFYLAF